MEPELQQAVRDIVQPAYEQFVLQAGDVMERSLGVTIAHLLWLEVLEQLELKRQYARFATVPELAGNNAHEIDRHLHLIDSKVKLAWVMIRLRDLRRAAPAQDLFSPVPPAAQPAPLDVDSSSSTASGSPLLGDHAENTHVEITPHDAHD